MKKKLVDLFFGFSKNEIAGLSPLDLNHPVDLVTSDSRETGPGVIFVAVRGHSQDGHQFLRDASNRNVLLMVGEDPPPSDLKAPYLRVLDSRIALAHLASAFYGNPSRSLLMVGITGTCGKTTTSYLVESILKSAGHQVGLIGTINFRYGTQILPSTHTTPGAVELQKIISQMRDAGCTAVVMEVSSHALKQKRTASIAFDGMVFTNLSPEHLDFHPDMEDYYQSKAILFSEVAEFSVLSGKSPVGVINRADEYGRRLLTELKGSTRHSYALREFEGGEGMQVTLEGISGQIDGISIESQLTGAFNGSNIAAAVQLAQGLKIPREKIEEGIKSLGGVPGRLERVPNTRGIHVWVDYAHKPDALENVLTTLNGIRRGHRLITVFGCGGDRDRTKRPVMGKIAVEKSDRVIITSDNPRTEDPNSIIQEILREIQSNSKVIVEVNRKKAIFEAIRCAQSGDLVLIAGKGHEDYQIIGTTKIHFDDREVALEAFQSLGHQD